jgi:glycosyltransferase involved in cell wall biosynthesis
MTDQLTIAAIVPCYNEEAAITKVVADLKVALPTATIFVYDNNSTDRTAELARRAGAIVREENRKGKGNVIRRAFADIEADVYVLIDGDDTYDAFAAAGMIDELVSGPFDQILGVRRETTATSYRPGHALGNRGFNALVSGIFGTTVSDMLSGYRVFSRRFVKSFPAVSREFEIETELTVHAVSLRVPQKELEVDFRDRPDGSESKLSTYRDGFKILSLIFNLTRHERPMLFHGLLAGALFLVALVLGLPVFIEFFQTGLVPRLPTAVLAATFVIVGFLSVLVGLILDGITKSRREVARLMYLQLPAVGVDRQL